VPAIPSLGHDVRMSAIVTEQRVIRPTISAHSS
jgi:5-formyltetrahydrofolate cyclo-ligase